MTWKYLIKVLGGHEIRVDSWTELREELDQLSAEGETILAVVDHGGNRVTV